MDDGRVNERRMRERDDTWTRGLVQHNKQQQQEHTLDVASILICITSQVFVWTANDKSRAVAIEIERKPKFACIQTNNVCSKRSVGPLKVVDKYSPAVIFIIRIFKIWFHQSQDV